MILSATFPSIRRFTGPEQLAETVRYGDLKFHTFPRDRMVKAQDVSMKAKPVTGIIAIAIFRITADGVPHICSMYPYLVFPYRLKADFNQRVMVAPVPDVLMGHGIFPAVINR